MPDRKDEIRRAMASVANYRGEMANYTLTMPPRRGQADGMPGGFAIAFFLHSAGNASNQLFRFYHKSLSGGWSATVERLSKISTFINSNKRRLPYFVDFHMHERLLQLPSSEVIPGIQMKVAPGKNLSTRLHALREAYTAGNVNASDLRFFAKAAENFRKMGQTFYDLGIAHGDLSNDNLFIDDDSNIYLVDYDSVYVPAMGTSYLQTTGGAESFQHPLRISANALRCSARDDDFSFLVIYLFLLCASKHRGAIMIPFDDRTIFNKDSMTDSASLRRSSEFQRFSAFADPEIQRVCTLLLQAVDARTLSSISCYFKQTAAPQPAKRSIALFCTNCGHKYESFSYKFCTNCGSPRTTFNI